MSGPPQDHARAYKVVISASSALAFMTIEFVWLLRSEVQHVWPRLRDSWCARIYVLARYIGIACQIFNVYFTVRMYLGIHSSPTGCRLWFVYQALVVQFLLAFVEYLLMRRLYALFFRHRAILLILLSFALSQVASMGVSARFAVVSNNYTETCLMVRNNPGNAFFSTTTMMMHGAIFFITFGRYLQLPAAWMQSRVGWVVFRDLACSVGAISAVMLFMTLCSLEVVNPSINGNITYYWLVSILWIAIGRITVNHEMLVRQQGEQGEEGSDWRRRPQLTSQLEMGESEWTLELDDALTTAATSSLQGPLLTPPGDHLRPRSRADVYGHERSPSPSPSLSSPGPSTSPD